ncbi:hypothetical protein [Gilvibacter sediminis]|uniref:hypothetical protein n=1 Tax=Gilvibacter sediminis TaxID=379071 RepID=UPI002350DAE5|nr:hypothetical protein [Gilvibacter sediminis]MDC7996882.1 hypothetical protein [Gilvibacter sediminis]
MIKGFRTYGLYGSKYACIEFSEFEGMPLYHALKADRRENWFTEIAASTLKSDEELTNWIGKQRHCTLVINTNQVLIKHLPKESSYSEDLILKAFPSIRLDDFYFDAVKGKSGFFIAICRKTAVEKIVASLNEKNINVVGVSLGFSSLSSIKSIFKEPHKIPCASGTVDIDDEGIVNYASVPQRSEKVKIQSDQIESAHLIALSALSNYLVDNPYTNLAKLAQSLKISFRGKQIFSRGWKIAGAFLFTLLLINAIVFNSLYAKKQMLTEQEQLIKTQQENYASRKSDLEQKEAIVKSILSNSGSKSSFYLNRIVATVPNHIQLIEFTYQPLVGSIRADKEINILGDHIYIHGTTNNPKKFAQWISDIEQLRFILTTQVDGFSDESRSSSIFSLTIKLQPQ